MPSPRNPQTEHVPENKALQNALLLHGNVLQIRQLENRVKQIQKAPVAAPPKKKGRKSGAAAAAGAAAGAAAAVAARDLTAAQEADDFLLSMQQTTGVTVRPAGPINWRGSIDVIKKYSLKRV
jgi:hypothetical protein